MERKESWVAYLLAGGWVFGFAGLHRFYLGRPVSGLIWLLTWGLFGIGQIVDLFLLPSLVDLENAELGFPSRRRRLPIGKERRRLAASTTHAAPSAVPSTPPAPSTPPPTDEQAVLQVAKESSGRVTAAMVAVETGLTLKKSQQLLDRMVKDRFAERDVSTQGADLYLFPGLLSNDPFEI